MSLVTALSRVLRAPMWSLRVVLPAGRGVATTAFPESPMQTATLARAAVRGLVVLASVSALVASGVAWTVQQRVSTHIVTSDAVAPHPVLIGQAFTALLVGLTPARTPTATRFRPRSSTRCTRGPTRANSTPTR